MQEQDRPTRTPLSTQQLLRRAEIAGPHIGALCQAMHQTLGEEAVRRILGVLNLTHRDSHEQQHRLIVSAQPPTA